MPFWKYLCQIGVYLGVCWGPPSVNNNTECGCSCLYNIVYKYIYYIFYLIWQEKATVPHHSDSCLLRCWKLKPPKLNILRDPTCLRHGIPGKRHFCGREPEPSPRPRGLNFESTTHLGETKWSSDAHRAILVLFRFGLSIGTLSTYPSS